MESLVSYIPHAIYKVRDVLGVQGEFEIREKHQKSTTRYCPSFILLLVHLAVEIREGVKSRRRDGEGLRICGI